MKRHPGCEEYVRQNKRKRRSSAATSSRDLDGVVGEDGVEPMRTEFVQVEELVQLPEPRWEVL